jgi:hypothetical protein
LGCTEGSRHPDQHARELGLAGDEVADLDHPVLLPAREAATGLRISPLAGAKFSGASPAQVRSSPSMMYPTVVVSGGAAIVTP